MKKEDDQLAQLVTLCSKHSVTDGINETALNDLIVYRGSHPGQGPSKVYQPMLIIGVQGDRSFDLEDRHYVLQAGNLFSLFLPMAITCSKLRATPEKPLLCVALHLDSQRLAEQIFRLEQVSPNQQHPECDNLSGVVSEPAGEKVLDAFIRLMALLDDPVEIAMLADGIINEIYFRMLESLQGGSFRALLRSQGQIGQVSRAVEYITQNYNQRISINQLAEIANMGSSTFHQKFKEVMHYSPVQYAKRIKLHKAHSLLLEGLSVSETAYQVGYNNLGQFSREFKRQFGTQPSTMS